VNVTTGDLEAGTSVPLRVLSEDEAKKRKWWDVPGFGAEVTLLALVALAVFLARRRNP